MFRKSGEASKLNGTEHWGPFPLLLLGAASLFILLPNLGNPLTGGHSDEPLYIGIAGEMMRSGKWAVPYYHQLPAFYKPPLLYWMMIVSFKLLRNSGLFAARLPAALCGAGLTIATACLGIRLFGKRKGLLAGWLTLTTIPGMYAFARAGLMDIPLTFFLTVSFLCGILAYQKESSAWLAFSFLCAGLSTLLKGPVSLPIFAVPLSWLFFSGKKWKLFLQWPALLGGLGVLLILLFWPAAVIANGEGKSWWRFFVLQENFGKFSGTLDPATHPTSGSVIWIHLFSQFMPWSFFLLAAFFILIFGKKERNPSVMFLLGWIFTVIFLFLLPEKKLSHYTLPALPACSLLVAALLLEPSPEMILRVAFDITGIVFSLTGVLLLLFSRITETAFSPILAAILFFAGAFFLFRKKLPAAAYAVAAFLLLFALGLPSLMSTLPVEKLKPIIQNQSISSYRIDYSILGTALQQEIPLMDAPESMRKRRGFLILPESDLPDFQQKNIVLSTSFLTWKEWKDHIRLLDILQAAISGDKNFIQRRIVLTRLERF